MNFKTEVNIIYLYIVEGLTMEKVGYKVGCTTSEVSETVRGYGFNNDGGQRSGWKLGKDCGRYKPGKPATHGLTITKTFLVDYMRNCEDWDYDFEDYVATYAENHRPPQRPQQPQRPQPRQPQQYTPQPQPSYWEQERQRQKAEQERLAREEAQRKAQQAQNERTASSLVQQGRAALARNDIRSAYDALNRAHSLNPTWGGDALLAECLARAGNADAHAADIISLLTEHFNGYTQGKHTMAPTADQYIWRAKAYLAQGNKNSACDDYFRAGDIYYEKKDYVNADRIYTEAREKTNYYSGATPDAAFRVAYARGKGKNNLSKDDYRSCVYFYREAVKNNQQKAYALGNMSWHLRMLGDYSEAAEAAQEAIDEGLNEEYVYNNLFYAQQADEEWEDAEETLDTMKYLGYDHASKRKSFYDKWLKYYLPTGDNDEMMELMERLDGDGQYYEPWLKSACLMEMVRLTDDDETRNKARAQLKNYLVSQPNNLDILCLLALDSDVSYADQLNYSKRYLNALPGADLSRCVDWHTGDFSRRSIIEEHINFLQKMVNQEAAENERKRKEAEEAARKKAEEDERRRKEAEEAARKKAEEDERRRKEAEAEAERKRKEAEAEAERKRKEAEEAARKKAEEDERRRKEAEEAERKRKEEVALLLLIL